MLYWYCIDTILNIVLDTIIILRYSIQYERLDYECGCSKCALISIDRISEIDIIFHPIHILSEVLHTGTGRMVRHGRTRIGTVGSPIIPVETNLLCKCMRVVRGMTSTRVTGHVPCIKNCG
jgi:hypothetical protein